MMYLINVYIASIALTLSWEGCWNLSNLMLIKMLVLQRRACSAPRHCGWLVGDDRECVLSTNVRLGVVGLGGHLRIEFLLSCHIGLWVLNLVE